MSPLTIFVLCHNRPDLIPQTLKSVLAQKNSAFELIVSDNSSNAEVEHVVAAEFPHVNYRRRLPMLQPLDHFNRCIEEVESEYFCLFHDDDVMDANFVESMEAVAREFPEAIAIGCNARIEKFGEIESRTSFRALGRYVSINTPLELSRRYFSRSQSGFAPFPGYIYKRSLVGDTRLLTKGGKYADVSWLLTLAGKGKIVWFNQPLMTYRLHGGNDGNTESLRDRLRLLGFLKQNRASFSEGVLSDYRCSFIYKKLVRSHGDLLPKARRHLARAFLNHYRWARYLRLDTYKALIVRKLIKLSEE